MLIEHYQVFFVAPVRRFEATNTPLSSSEPEASETMSWLKQYINVPAWNHTILTNQRHLLYGDYLIESINTKGSMATRIAFGSDTFKTWDDIIEYFERLGGQ